MDRGVLSEMDSEMNTDMGSKMDIQRYGQRNRNERQKI